MACREQSLRSLENFALLLSTHHVTDTYSATFRPSWPIRFLAKLTAVRTAYAWPDRIQRIGSCRGVKLAVLRFDPCRCEPHYASPCWCPDQISWGSNSNKTKISNATCQCVCKCSITASLKKTLRNLEKVTVYRHQGEGKGREGERRGTSSWTPLLNRDLSKDALKWIKMDPK